MSGTKWILCDSRWSGPHGIGRFAAEIMRRVPGLVPLRGTFPLLHPLDAWRLAREIRERAPSVFFSPGFNAPVATPGIPMVFTLHDLNYVHVPSNTTVLKRAYFATIIKSACRLAARVLTVSEFSRQQIVEWAHVPEDSVVNVGNGVDSAFSPIGERYSPGFPYVFVAGRQAPHKNLRRLAQALARSKAGREVKLLITGDPTDETRRWIAEDKMENLIRFSGVVPDAILPNYYRGALLLAMPSLFEGFGLPVLEAMASGTPVITSTRTSLPEIAGNAALLVDPTDTADISQALDRLVFDADLRETLRQKGIARSHRFTWEATADGVSKALAYASQSR